MPIHYSPTGLYHDGVTCGATDIRGLGPTKAARSSDIAKVTCKRCLKVLATKTLERYLDEIGKSHRFLVTAKVTDGDDVVSYPVYAEDEEDAIHFVRALMYAEGLFEIKVERVKGGV